jgi:hypothetical protein
LARATPSGTMAMPTPAATSAIAQSSDSAIAAGWRDADAARPKKFALLAMTAIDHGDAGEVVVRSRSFSVSGCDGGSAAT